MDIYQKFLLLILTGVLRELYYLRIKLMEGIVGDLVITLSLTGTYLLSTLSFIGRNILQDKARHSAKLSYLSSSYLDRSTKRAVLLENKDCGGDCGGFSRNFVVNFDLCLINMCLHWHSLLHDKT